MASIATYTRSLWDAQRTIAMKIGMDLRRAPFEVRATVVIVDLTLAVLIKALTDGGVLTDANLSTRMNAVRDATYPTLPYSPPSVPEDGADDPMYPDPIAGA
jgi:hypothetical protein